MLAWLSVPFAILGYAWLRPVAEKDYVVAWIGVARRIS